ncbi:PIN domain-containing protein [Thermosynechococcaceae cyanobacterium BACA0444]|uniref:PIN domain-containing protein n=1 Tax=Pseudocalidococcus azoricus BACA0444 TaxID=2918990 RepID=A0AAE4FTD0_9CYAN|nr:PIN domain-containing protein [Pseudocalidococcus azoricus]MDS3860590.1 PIN domain-containing protein [Pseudocalidococcus azoricus BACA0444]
MKILIDANVLLDVALEREPFFNDSDCILALCEQKTLIGYVSASSFSDLFYILRKSKGKSLALDFLRHIVSFCQIATVDDAIIRQALTGNFKDFEDGVQYEAATASQLDGIVTRNPKDFTDRTVPIYTPQKLIEANEVAK